MEILPTEILVDIFSYLSYSDQQTCCTVCERWYTIIHDDPTLLIYSSVIVLDYSSINDPEMVDQYFENFSQTILDKGRHLGIEGLTLVGWSVFEILSKWNTNWERFLSGLKYLDVKSSDSSVLLWLSKVVKFCSDSLESIRFVEIRYDDFNMSEINFSFSDIAHALCNVRQLTVTASEEMSGGLLHRLIGLMPNLESLSFRDRLGHITVSELVMALQQLPQAQIKVLNLDWTNINDIELSELGNIPELQLSELSLSGCTNLNTNAMIDFCSKKGIHLKILNISWCKKIIMSEREHVNLIKNLVNIRDLNLTGLVIRNEVNLYEAFEHLSKLNNLKVSELEVADENLSNGLCSNTASLLSHLEIQETLMNHKQLMKIINFHHQITHLDLSRSKAANNQVMQTVISSLPKLESLRLSGCINLSDNGFTGQSKWEHKNEQEQKIDSLKNLKELSLGGIMITDACVQSAFKFKDLRKMNISMCRYLTNEGIVKISTFNSHLQSLEARWCLLSDAGLLKIISSLHRLTELDLEGCDKISKKSIQQIPLKCKQLRKLVLSGCGITESEIKTIFNNQRPNLRVSFNPLYTPKVKSTQIARF